MGIGRRKKTEILRQSIVDFENMQVLHRIDTARGIYFFEESQNIPPFFSPPLEEGRKFNVSVKRQAYGTLVGLICRATFLIEPCIPMFFETQRIYRCRKIFYHDFKEMYLFLFYWNAACNIT